MIRLRTMETHALAGYPVPVFCVNPVPSISCRMPKTVQGTGIRYCREKFNLQSITDILMIFT
jgi:hypothetical protein